MNGRVLPSSSTLRRVVAVAATAVGLCAGAHAQDPGALGPQPVAVGEYNFGDQAFRPSGFPAKVELRGSVAYPAGLAGGPYPVVLMMHGRHATCYDAKGVGLMAWPCVAPGQSPITSFRGYEYFARLLASRGYVVVSVSANGINAVDASTGDRGMQARAELLQRHLDLWRTFNTTGGAPFGNQFIGRLNLQNVGTMGHSRGGEGVVRHYLLNQSLGSPYGIKAVLPLAPVDFLRSVVPGVPLGVVLPYCDGDVSDLRGVHLYDDARYAQSGDPAPKHYAVLMGANHNFFNTAWTPGLFPGGTSDDWLRQDPDNIDPHCASTASSRLTAAQQRNVGSAYMAAFFRRYIGGETAFDPLLKGDVAPPPSAQGAVVRVGYHAPDQGWQRRDVNRLLGTTRTMNTLGGNVTDSNFGLVAFCGGPNQVESCLSSQPLTRQPHAGGLSQLHLAWSSRAAAHVNQLPAGSRDVRAFQTLQFRAALDFTDTRVLPSQRVDSSVRLTDGRGRAADVAISAFSQALAYPPGRVGAVPKAVLTSVRLPLSAFVGLDLSDIRSVELRFDRTERGTVLISDLAFTDAR